MEYKLINCDSVLKKILCVDSLFHGNYCIDPYQNCEFGCQYCDSSFEKKVYIKKNIIEVLRKELNLIRNGRIIIGSVHDPYQKAEEVFQLTKSILETLNDYHFSCHILTKSPLVFRDISLISRLDCLVTISISSLNDDVVRIFESNTPPPTDRLSTIKKLRNHNIFSGLALIPVLPYITESEIESLVRAARSVDAKYLLHKHLELKGDQKTYFRNLIKIHYPHLLTKYDALYGINMIPHEQYIQELNKTILHCCNKFNIHNRIILNNMIHNEKE